jgi:hypothetical protein
LPLFACGRSDAAVLRVGVVDEWLADEPAGTSEEVLGEAELLGLRRGVPEGGDPDEPVAGPLGGLPEVEVERLSRRGDHVAVGQGHLRGAGLRPA